MKRPSGTNPNVLARWIVGELSGTAFGADDVKIVVPRLRRVEDEEASVGDQRGVPASSQSSVAPRGSRRCRTARRSDTAPSRTRSDPPPVRRVGGVAVSLTRSDQLLRLLIEELRPRRHLQTASPIGVYCTWTGDPLRRLGRSGSPFTEYRLCLAAHLAHREMPPTTPTTRGWVKRTSLPSCVQTRP
jgi:hypothetical protein